MKLLDVGGQKLPTSLPPPDHAHQTSLFRSAASVDLSAPRIDIVCSIFPGTHVVFIADQLF
jgi:hypothetical protein